MSTQRWISINAIVFLILILGICIAMSKFSLQSPPPTHSSLPMPLINNSTVLTNSTLLTHEDNGERNSLESTESNEMTTIDNTTTTITNNTTSISSVEGGETTDTSLDAELVPGLPNPANSDESEGKKTSPVLQLYIASILTNCLALPIFLGLVASKASKYEMRGKNLLDTT